VEPRAEPPAAACAFCRTPLGARRPGARYCGALCRAKASQARHRQELLAAIAEVERAARRLRVALAADDEKEGRAE